MQTTIRTVSPFQLKLASIAIEAIAAMRSEGTVGASVDCLWQAIHLRGVDCQLKGAPRGTNSVYYAKEIFADVCESVPCICSFIID